jgi:hypothetical protein
VEGITELDGAERYLCPGLWDMHTHNMWSVSYSKHYAFNGVIGVRNMYTPMPFIKALKDSIERGLLPGPHILAGGRIVDGPGPFFKDWFVADKLDKIPAILDSIQAEGSDFVKVYDAIPADVYFELARQAKARGMYIAGHIPIAVSPLEAAMAGQRSFEHLFGLFDLCVKDPVIDKSRSTHWQGLVMYNEKLASAELDYKLAMENLGKLSKYNVYVCPTLSVWRNAMDPYRDFTADVELPYFDSMTQSFWANSIKQFQREEGDPEALLVRTYDFMRQMTSVLHFAGVKMMLGTDAINPYVYPGFSIHTEIQCLQESEISDEEILKIAAWNPVEYLGLESDFGSIEKDKMASFLILSENPLYDLGALRSMEGIVLKGYYYNRATMDSWMKSNVSED